MADSQVLESPSNSRGRGRRPRGGRFVGNRGGRGGQRQRGQQDTERRQPPAATPAAPAAPTASAGTPSESRGGRGRRGPRGSRRGGNEGSHRAMLGRPRTFGGHLTSAETEESDSTTPAGLNVGAREFVPGQPLTEHNTNNTIRPKVKINATQRVSKSTAEDLPTRIHEDISNGQYECVICTNEVLRNSKVWSCSICWTVTHMSCVNKWFSNRARNSDQQQSNWRCPGCNSPMTDEPSTYHCWCGKEISPKPIPGLSPHSCGQTCSKPKATCPHPCPLECHAGPCPPCLQMGPSQSCFCGKHTSTKRCGETDYVHGWSCHEICGDLLPCGEHECEKECHSGLCGSCEVPVFSVCYCGRESKEIPCEQRGDKNESYNYGQVSLDGDLLDCNDLPENWYWGSFSCDAICDRSFDCGKHSCEKGCHTQDENAAHCPFSPDLITHCPCGKTPLTEILDQPRQGCEDPIPNCKEICNKSLPCGHLCQDACHSGSCAPCMQRMEISCRCGRTKTSSVCHQGTVETPECMRICRAQLNCGRHEHGEHCCPGEKKAMERMAAKRKNRHAGPVNDEVEAEHICTRPCGRELKCGKHQCQQICHKGPCPSCPEAIFEEISCNCGRTVLQPPQPCGTQPPECRFDCTRPRPCGHPQVSHNCHTDSEPCPKCPFLVEKRCVCGKKPLKNQPCWFEEPRCGLPCGQKLRCGSHACRKTCHRPGECEDADSIGSRCKQPCGKTRNCGHLDAEQCHAPYPCKEDKPCQAKSFITCDCQRRKQEVKCMATKNNPSPQREALKCDEECLRLQRNARLADALNIDPQTHTDNHIPYSDTTLKLFKENTQFAQTYEREYRVFASETSQKFIRFKPMKSQQRAFLHSLAEDFGFDSESADPEPHRHVCLFKTPRFVAAPMKTLGQCVKIRAQQIPPAQSSATDSSDTAAMLPFNALLLTIPRFGLTIEEIDSALEREYAAYPSVKFHTSFLPSDEVVIKGSGAWTPQILESSLTALKPTLSRTVKRAGICEGVFLCHVDDSLNVLRNERDSQTHGEGGWNAVVGRSAARPKPPPANPVSLRSNFVAFKKEPKKKVEQQPVEDDWEEAADKLDEE
ncbi:hypothetical protein F4821DRAFT_220964 [Hypoxylon rubiginosum]|uniref:Uncharacterized protein n=1 Tax=Hypoxylon rubiginosum TaxID=110542 RepID=A0ACC0DLE1_9PEZI|nr:hypothetical protein F4821DRAFT_220964 [Hypoxylon rubiginosum]